MLAKQVLKSSIGEERMNPYTVALCYPAYPTLVDGTLLEIIRARLPRFGLRSEYFIDQRPAISSWRNVTKLSRGYDLVVIVTDNSVRNMEYNLLGMFNQNMTDPWATCALTVNSIGWKGPQPTLSIESERYIGHFTLFDFPGDLLVKLQNHRSGLFARGLRQSEWDVVKRGVSPEVWERLTKTKDV